MKDSVLSYSVLVNGTWKLDLFDYRIGLFVKLELVSGSVANYLGKWQDAKKKNPLRMVCKKKCYRRQLLKLLYPSGKKSNDWNHRTEIRGEWIRNMISGRWPEMIDTDLAGREIVKK